MQEHFFDINNNGKFRRLTLVLHHIEIRFMVGDITNPIDTQCVIHTWNHKQHTDGTGLNDIAERIS